MCSCKQTHTSHVMFHLAKSLPIQITICTHYTDCAIFRDQRSFTHFGIDVFSHQRDPVIILLIDTAPAADQLPHVRQHGGWALGLHTVHRAHVHSWQTHRQVKKWEADDGQKEFRTEVTWQSSSVRDQTRWDLSLCPYFVSNGECILQFHMSQATNHLHLQIVLY